jgi:RNA polymerase sigma-70 factor (ECF subfamily)
MSGSGAEERSDSDLLKAAIEGDEQAFWEFCVRSLPALLNEQRAQCRSVGISPAMAEDFVNESLVKAVQWLRKHKPRKISKAWLMVISRNTMIDWIRRNRFSKRSTSQTIDQLEDTARNETEIPVVLECFDDLSDRDKEVLELILFQDRSPPEAAQILGIEVWAAYKRYERALKRLRDLLKNAEQP